MQTAQNKQNAVSIAQFLIYRTSKQAAETVQSEVNKRKQAMQVKVGS